MTKPWIASVPQVQTRVEPADDGSDLQRVSVTVSFAVASAGPGETRPAGPHWHGPLRMAVGAWWEQQGVAPPVVRVPDVVGDSQPVAHEALRQAGLVPADLPTLLPTDPVTGAGLEADLRVVRQAPGGGTYVSPASPVELEYEAAPAASLGGEPEPWRRKGWVDFRPPCDLVSCEWSALRFELEFIESAGLEPR